MILLLLRFDLYFIRLFEILEKLSYSIVHFALLLLYLGGTWLHSCFVIAVC